MNKFTIMVKRPTIVVNETERINRIRGNNRNG